MGPPLEPPEPVVGEDGIRRWESVGRWPTVFIESGAFGRLTRSERLHRLALGYVASAKTLCLELGENPETLDWPRASVACFCCYHSAELFLKACILHREPSRSLGTHAVSTLQREYHRLYPFDRYFALRTPWNMALGDIVAAFGAPPGTVLREDWEEKTDQVYRYLSGKAEESPKSTFFFAPGVWLELAERLEEDYRRIWENIQEAYPVRGKSP